MKNLLVVAVFLFSTGNLMAGEWRTTTITSDSSCCIYPQIDRATGEVWWWSDEKVIREGTVVIDPAPNVISPWNWAVGGGKVVYIATDLSTGEAKVYQDNALIAQGFDPSWEQSYGAVKVTGNRFSQPVFNRSGDFVLLMEYQVYSAGVLQGKTRKTLTAGGENWFPVCNEDPGTSLSQYLWPAIIAEPDKIFALRSDGWRLYHNDGSAITPSPLFDPSFIGIRHASAEGENVVVCSQYSANYGVLRYNLPSGTLTQLSSDTTYFSGVAGNMVAWTVASGGNTTVKVMCGSSLRPPLTIRRELEGGPISFSGDKVVWSNENFQVMAAVWEETSAVTDWQKY